MATEVRPATAKGRLARSGTRPNTARMRRFLKAYGVSVQPYMTWSGGQPLNAFAEANPGWTQRAWEVLLLENLDLLQKSTQQAVPLSGQQAKKGSVGHALYGGARWRARTKWAWPANRRAVRFASLGRWWQVERESTPERPPEARDPRRLADGFVLHPALNLLAVGGRQGLYVAQETGGPVEPRAEVGHDHSLGQTDHRRGV